MAESGQSKTYAPTPRRREEARRQGQVALSLDFTNSVQLLAGVLALWCGASAIAAGLLHAMHSDLAGIQQIDATTGSVQGQFVAMMLRGLALTGLVIGLLVVTGLAVSVVQVGFHITPELTAPRWDRLSLAQGWERVFSRTTAIRGLMSVLKVSLVAAVSIWVLRGRVTQIRLLSETSLAPAAVQAWCLAIRLALAVAATLVVIGAADYLFQRWRFEQSLMMTSQEMREQLKEDEGDPQTKARLRRLAREVSKAKQLKDVPGATVVVTNPTHLAIALRYDRGLMPAPRVVAKGSGMVAKRIAEIARRHGVPVLERKPLAQALFKAVRVGQDIPAALYYAVAELLAYVYKLRNAA
jgi:flagellar biosynthetic protein FlhB